MGGGDGGEVDGKAGAWEGNSTGAEMPPADAQTFCCEEKNCKWVPRMISQDTSMEAAVILFKTHNSAKM